jgi:cobalamin biosynthesis Co2+ chelatase CbiK
MKSLETQIGGSHYEDMKIQPIEFIMGNNLDFLQGNILKYICRYKSKNGLQDLLKARHYLDILIEHEQRRTESGDSTIGERTSREV